MAKKTKAEAEGTAPTEAENDSGDGEQRERPDGVVEWAKSILIAVVLFLVLRSFLVQTFVITSGSMEETLLVGDFLMVNRAAIGSRIPLTSVRIPGYSEPRRGDVLVFDPPHEEELKLVKRLIGLPGDTLQMRNRVLYRNGEVVEEPYLKHSDVADEMHPWMDWQREHVLSTVNARSYAPTRDTWGPLEVPQGYLFMMGDNRETSFDSRYWGLLEEDKLEGRAVFIYFSYNKESYRPFPWVREVRWGRVGSGIH